MTAFAPQFRRVDYLIALHPAISKFVAGYAMSMPEDLAHIRLCLRKDTGYWRIDHYDTGRSFGGPLISVTEESPEILTYFRAWSRFENTRLCAAQWVIRYLRHLRDERAEFYGRL